MSIVYKKFNNNFFVFGQTIFKTKNEITYDSSSNTFIKNNKRNFNEINNILTKKIRYELAKVIRARTVPELHFFLDDSMEYGSKMEQLINEVSAKDRLNKKEEQEEE